MLIDKKDSTMIEKLLFWLKNSIWQDIVIAVGQWIMAIGLIPTVIGIEKPPILTSLPTALILYTFSFAFWTLHMKNSALSAFLVASLWFIIFIQVLVR